MQTMMRGILGLLGGALGCFLECAFFILYLPVWLFTNIKLFISNIDICVWIISDAISSCFWYTKQFISNINICFWAIKQLINTKILAHYFDPKYRHAGGTAWPKLSRACGAAYPKSQLEVCDTPELLKYAMRHAMCAYPPTMLVAFGELPAYFLLPFMTTKHVLQHCFDLESTDLESDDLGYFDDDIESHTVRADIESHTVRVKFDEDIESHIVSFEEDTEADNVVDFEDGQTTNQPSFYLCVDRNQKRIVVSVRGTSDMLDVLTDLNAKPMPYLDGYVHDGMANSAKYVLDAIQDDKDACDLLCAYRDYDVLFCGHSLGAGVAALMAMLVLNGEASVFAEFAKNNKIRAFAFASPPVASRSLIQPDQDWNRVVTSVALSTDLVTRISVRSLETHDERCECISKWNETEELDVYNEYSLIQRLKDMGEADGQMFPLGKVLWYVPDVRQAGKDKSIVVFDDCPRDKDLRLIGFLNTALMYVCALLDGKVGSVFKFVFGVALQALIAVVMVIGVVIGFEIDDIEIDRSLSVSEKYGAARYQLCDATGCKEEIFQNLILDIESLHAHFPNRYLWACGVTLKPAQD